MISPSNHKDKINWAIMKPVLVKDKSFRHWMVLNFRMIHKTMQPYFISSFPRMAGKEALVD